MSSQQSGATPVRAQLMTNNNGYMEDLLTHLENRVWQDEPLPGLAEPPTKKASRSPNLATIEEEYADMLTQDEARADQLEALRHETKQKKKGRPATRRGRGRTVSKKGKKPA